MVTRDERGNIREENMQGVGGHLVGDLESLLFLDLALPNPNPLNMDFFVLLLSLPSISVSPAPLASCKDISSPRNLFHKF